MSVYFKEDTHQYFNSSTGDEYYSGTRFLHLFEPEFDKDTISKRVALKEGKTQQQVLAEWAAINKESTDKGSRIHLAMENFIKFEEQLDEYKVLYETFKKCVGNDYKYAEAIHSEKLLWIDEYKIAGTADLIIDHKNNEFSVGDFKTNKKFEYYSGFGNRMKAPVEHLSQCQHNLYALQLSLYAYMYSLLTGKKVRHLFLMHCNNSNEGWKYISCNYLKYEVQFMLKYYKDYIMKR
jgi:hypothetical protein